MQATTDGILDAIASEVSVDPAALKPEATLESLGLSSLDIVSALFAVEDRFGIEVTADEAATARTLGDLIALIQAKDANATKDATA